MGMAKLSKKQGKPTQKPGQQGKTAVKRRQHSQIRPQKHEQPAKSKSAQTPNEPRQANQRPKIPFTKRDNVLLIGEGDFSFALSLVRYYRPKSLTATCYDSESELVQKYPNAKATIDQLLATSPRSKGAQSGEDPNAEDAFEGFSPPTTPKPDHEQISQASSNRNIQVLYGIDATRLSTTHLKALRRLGPFTKIVFNFPHVGGLSTDINRQVRANQALLVAFFEAAKPLLASPHPPRSPTHPGPKSDRYDTDSSYSSDASSDPTHPPPQPQILITLFTTHPYTLWNIRDLARHSGLSVAESFRFPWAAYPGYTHARTAGDIVTGKDRSDEGKRRGAWRGEEREARTYVLGLRDGSSTSGGGGGGGAAAQRPQQQQQQQQQKKTKRKRSSSSSDDIDSE